MIRGLYVTCFVIFLSVQSGCTPGNRIQAEKAADNSMAAFENLLAGFKTVVDDKTAGEELQNLNKLYDDLVASVSELEEAQKKSYATGGGLVIRDQEMGQLKTRFGSEFAAHRDSLPDSTLAILKPFFEKLENGPIK